MPRRKRWTGLVPSLLPDVLNPVHQLRVMGRLVRRRTTRPGTAPGTLVAPPVDGEGAVALRVLEYGGGGVREMEPTGVEALPPVPPHPAVTWLNVDGVHDVDLVRALGERFGLHPLVLEDVVSRGQRPKIEEHGAYLYLVLPMLSIDPGTGTVREEQVSLVLGDGWVLTFQERPGDVFDPVRERLRSPVGRLRAHGPDYLAYALVDAIVDHYFVVLEVIGDAAERLELEVLEGPVSGAMHRLHALKREMLIVRRAVWPVREMLNALVRTESPLVTDSTRVFLRDVHDHAVRVIETVEVLRDVTSGLIDLHLSNLSHRTNEVMKTLTVIASIFIPLTFIVGVYGMNFDHMPELGWPWAYPALLAAMLSMTVGMLWYFRRKGWL